MSRHRLDPPRRVRPRYGRMGAAAVSLIVTAVALLGGLGVLPVEGSPGRAGQNAAATGSHEGANGSAPRTTTTGANATQPSRSPSPTRTAGTAPTTTPTATTPAADAAALPAGTGQGRRVVFSKGAQRVWLVDGAGSVASTYLVSGSLTNNLHPGAYAVYSRSRWAVGVQDTGVMQYFVRFAHGAHAAIGFHSIPTQHGTPLQTEAQLGTPQSHGCIRQKLSDAVRMWNFADVGTDVVVIA